MTIDEMMRRLDILSDVAWEAFKVDRDQYYAGESDAYRLVRTMLADPTIPVV